MIVTVIVPLVAVMLTLGGGWLVSTRVSDHWDQIKRRRESDQAAAGEFQRLYGKFFAVWKRWNSIALGEIALSDREKAVWDCLESAAKIEGDVESLLAKISVERCLSEDDINALGAVRQGFKSIRSAIRKGKPLPWWGSETEQYAAFKELALYTTRLLSAPSEPRQAPNGADAAMNFRSITSNRHEGVWPDTPKRLRGIRNKTAVPL